MAKIVSVDSGKYATKALLKKEENNKKISFRTKMDHTLEDKASDGRSCVFEYAGEKVLIGEVLLQEQLQSTELFRQGIHQL